MATTAVTGSMRRDADGSHRTRTGYALAIIPGTSQLGTLEDAEWISALITAFLDTPMPEDS